MYGETVQLGAMSLNARTPGWLMALRGWAYPLWLMYRINLFSEILYPNGSPRGPSKLLNVHVPVVPAYGVVVHDPWMCASGLSDLVLGGYHQGCTT